MKDNKSTSRFSKMRSNTFTLPKEGKKNLLFKGEGNYRRTTRNKRAPSKKPSHLSKRSVSLPTDLEKNNVTTRKLFWFIPKDNRCHRRSNRCRISFLEGGHSDKTFGSDSKQNVENGRIVRESVLPLCKDIPERAALEWITKSSTHSLSDSTVLEQSDECSDNDDHDDPLLGLEFVENIKE